jgi:Protein of unknown function (DUF3558)
VRLRLVPIAAAGILVLAGCSPLDSDDQRRDADIETSTADTGRPTIPAGDASTAEPDEPSETAASESGTTDLHPCDLLTAAERSHLELGEQTSKGTEEVVGPGRMCQWQSTGSHTTSVAILDELGPADVVSSGEKTPTTIGGRDAVQYLGPLGTCAISLGVTDKSRVDVMSTAGGDVPKACRIAKEAAELVEPKLP